MSRRAPGEVNNTFSGPFCSGNAGPDNVYLTTTALASSCAAQGNPQHQSQDDRANNTVPLSSQDNSILPDGGSLVSGLLLHYETRSGLNFKHFWNLLYPRTPWEGPKGRKRRLGHSGTKAGGHRARKYPVTLERFATSPRRTLKCGNLEVLTSLR